MHAMWTSYKNKSKVQNSVLDYTVCMHMDEDLGLGVKDWKDTFVQYSVVLYNIIFKLVHILVKQSGIQGLLASTPLFLLPFLVPLRVPTEHSLRNTDPASALVILS